MPRGLYELTYSFVYPKRIECRLLPFLLCETCVICLYYILCLLWIGYTPLITFSITFHTQTQTRCTRIILYGVYFHINGSSKLLHTTGETANNDCLVILKIRECIHCQIKCDMTLLTGCCFGVIWPKTIENIAKHAQTHTTSIQYFHTLLRTMASGNKRRKM